MPRIYLPAAYLTAPFLRTHCCTLPPHHTSCLPPCHTLSHCTHAHTHIAHHTTFTTLSATAHHTLPPHTPLLPPAPSASTFHPSPADIKHPHHPTPTPTTTTPSTPHHSTSTPHLPHWILWLDWTLGLSGRSTLPHSRFKTQSMACHFGGPSQPPAATWRARHTHHARLAPLPPPLPARDSTGGRIPSFPSPPSACAISPAYTDRHWRAGRAMPPRHPRVVLNLTGAVNLW